MKQVIDFNRLSKQEYQKPTMRVVELHQNTHLLAGSGENTPKPNEWDDDFGYVPGIGNDMNHLA